MTNAIATNGKSSTPSSVAGSLDLPFLRNTWYVALWADDLAPGQLVARKILNEPVVLFRTPSGSPAAIEDRCCHRFAALSMGSLRTNGNVCCPYHGLEFDAAGCVVHNPHGKIPANARVATYSVVEKHSAIWIWMGDRPAEPEKIPDFSIMNADTPNPTNRRDYILMQARWDLIADNLLDLSHAAFIHDGLLGNAEMGKADTIVEQEGDTVYVTRNYYNVPPPAFHDLVFLQDGAPIDARNRLRWDAPACMINETYIMRPGESVEQGTVSHGIHLITPETQHTSHYHFVAVRERVIPRTADELAKMKVVIDEMRHTIFDTQDHVIIREQNDRMVGVNRKLTPVMLSIDAGVIKARRILARLIAEEAPAPSATAQQAESSVG